MVQRRPCRHSLGAYGGKTLYISARDDGDGVFALNKLQHEHGIQIKFFSGGIFRRYTPGAPEGR